MSNEVTTYRIRVQFMAALEAEIAHLNKKAVKLGVAPAVLVIHGTETVENKNSDTGIVYTTVFNIVSVTGETPKLAGWKLVAVVETLASGENLLSCVPNEVCPPQYRNANAQVCNHCNTSRRRAEVFVVVHEDGRTAQVGRQCLADFLGGQSPEGIVSYASWAFGLERTLSDAESEFWGGGGHEPVGFNIDEFLKTTAALIRKLGWISRTVARQLEGASDEQSSTASNVVWLLSRTWSQEDAKRRKEFVARNAIVLEERDAKLATEALAWGAALPTNDGDYIYNLGVACRLGFVTTKTTGLVASVIAAYQRHLDKEAELNMKRAANKERKHVGTVGERTGFAQVTVKAIRSFDSEWGARTLIRFEDAAGNVLCWWKSGDTQFEEGQTFDITGTVKSHEDWKGTPQTLLQRVTKGLPKVKKARKTKAVAAPSRDESQNATFAATYQG